MDFSRGWQASGSRASRSVRHEGARLMRVMKATWGLIALGLMFLAAGPSHAQGRLGGGGGGFGGGGNGLGGGGNGLGGGGNGLGGGGNGLGGGGNGLGGGGIGDTSGISLHSSRMDRQIFPATPPF